MWKPRDSDTFLIFVSISAFAGLCFIEYAKRRRRPRPPMLRWPERPQFLPSS